MDAHLRELVEKGLIAFGYRVIGAVLVFTLQIILARKMGAYEFGLYSLCVALIMFLSSIARMGLDMGIVRKVAGAIATGNPESANAWLIRSLQVALAAGTVIAALLFFLSEWLAGSVFKEGPLSDPLRIFAFTVPVAALMFIVAEGLKGLKDVASAAIVQSIIAPLLLLSILFFVPAQFSSYNVAFIYLGVTLIAFLYGYFKWSSSIGRGGKLHIPPLEVLRFGWPFFLASIGSILLTWSDTIIVGMFANAEAVAGYYAASKLATLTSFILISINAISAPKFSAMHAQGDKAGLERLARQSTAIMISLALIPTILLVSFPAFWLGLFGKKFEQAEFALLILTAGQTINVACGSVGLLLAMTGHERLMSRVFVTTAIITLAVSLVLGMLWGAKGVAVATAIGMATWNIWMLVAVRRNLGFWTFPLLTVRSRA